MMMITLISSGEACPNLVMQMQLFCVYRPYKELISEEINNDNDLDLHGLTKCRADFAMLISYK